MSLNTFSQKYDVNNSNMNNSLSDRQKYFEKRPERNDRTGYKIYIMNRHIEEFRKLSLAQERKQEEIIGDDYRGKGILLNMTIIEYQKERNLLRKQQIDELLKLQVGENAELGEKSTLTISDVRKGSITCDRICQ